MGDQDGQGVHQRPKLALRMGERDLSLRGSELGLQHALAVGSIAPQGGRRRAPSIRARSSWAPKGFTTWSSAPAAKLSTRASSPALADKKMTGTVAVAGSERMACKRSKPSSLAS